MESSREELGENGSAFRPALAPLTSHFSFFRAFKFPGLLCDFRGLECDRAGESITE